MPLNGTVCTGHAKQFMLACSGVPDLLLEPIARLGGACAANRSNSVKCCAIPHTCANLHQSHFTQYRVTLKNSDKRTVSCSKGVFTPCRACVYDTLDDSARMQEVREVLQWLREQGVSGKAMERLMQNVPTPSRFRTLPSVATADANFTTLKDMLHMSDAQVRLKHWCRCAHFLRFCLCPVITCLVFVRSNSRSGRFQKRNVRLFMTFCCAHMKFAVP